MALRDEGCAARAVIQQLDATTATKNEVQRISTIYVGVLVGKQGHVRPTGAFLRMIL